MLPWHLQYWENLKFPVDVYVDVDVDFDVDVDVDIDVDIDEPVKEGQFLQSESHLLQPRSHVSEQKVSN